MSDLTWRKSTYSAEAANCVEIATTPSTIRIRDSKNPAGTWLAFSSLAWREFLSRTADAGSSATSG